MQHCDSNTGGCSLEALILACEGPVRGLAWSFARASSRVDVEEFCSIGMFEVCQAAACAARVENPMGYLYQTAKNGMCEEWRRLHDCPAVSLDAPLSRSGDGALCLADLLAAPASGVDASRERERAVHDALGRLTTRQRGAVRRRAGLPGYGVHSLDEMAQALHCSPQVAHLRDLHGRRSLARDYKLCRVVGVEVEA